MRRPEDPVAGLLDMAREPERRLASELRHDPDRLLPVADRQHLLRRERLEVEPVGRVVIGRNGLRVAVDHHGLVAECAEGLRRVDAAVVELDALPDPVRAGAENHDPGLLADGGSLVLLAPGGVEVVRGGLDLTGAGIDPPERGANAALMPETADLAAAQTERRADRVVAPAGALRASDVARRELCPGACELSTKPRVQAFRQLLVFQALPRRRRALVELARAECLEKGLCEGPADAHRLSDRLHLRAERRIGARELLEREARELDDDVVERRLEARGSGLREVVRDLVERVTDRELGRDLRDRVARGLRRKGRGA